MSPAGGSGTRGVAGAPTGDVLARRAARTPERLALIDARDGDRTSYGELDDRVDRVAGHLAGTGVGADDRVGLLLEPRPAAIELVFAACRVGAVTALYNPRHAVPELARDVERADLDLLVCSAATVEDAVAARDRVDHPADGVLPLASVDDPLPADDVPALDAASAPVTRLGRGPEDTQLLLFTSGTTGTPKLVPLTAGNLRASAVASGLRLGTDPADRWYSPLATCHVGGLAPALRSALYGSAVVLAREFDATRAFADLVEYDCTAASLVPTMLRRLLAVDPSAIDAAPADGADSDPGTALAALRFVLLGGAPAPQSLVERAVAADVPVCPTYGLTEAASQVATVPPGEADAATDTVGPPLFDTDVTIVDDAGDPVPPGDAGEIVVDGPTVTPGYLGGESTGGDDATADAADDAMADAADDATADAADDAMADAADDAMADAADDAMADAMDDAGGVAMDDTADDATDDAYGEHGLHTGDVGRLEDGWLTVLGRLTDRIVTGGENVDPAAVAAVLSDHPDVADAAVVGLPDEEWGERVAALVVRATDSSASPDADALRVHCRERLAGYECPRTIAFADGLPRTTSGTVDRERVRSLLRAGDGGIA